MCKYSPYKFVSSKSYLNYIVLTVCLKFTHNDLIDTCRELLKLLNICAICFCDVPYPNLIKDLGKHHQADELF